MQEVSVCHSGYFRAKCAWDELLVIARARYGRMRINKCVSENFGYVGCHMDVVDVLDRYCSGRRTCHVRVLDETFTDSSSPCHEDLNLYLHVEYQCVRGVMCVITAAVRPVFHPSVLSKTHCKDLSAIV